MTLFKHLFFLGSFLFLLNNNACAYETTITVSKDGSGDFSTIQEAIYNTKAFPDQRITIFVKNGIYNEKVTIPAFNTNLSIIGESKEKTIITWNDHFCKIDKGRNSTFYTYSFKVEANDFYAENLTIQNTSGPVGQAVALHITGNRVAFHNCNILGHQDTLYCSGENSKNYFYQCRIEGTTDFIFGEATILFEACRIHSLADSYITAASTPKDKKFGMVFLNCELTAAVDVSKVLLGRPWRDYARVAFLHCQMGAHILPQGWANWSGTNRSKTACYVEYQNTGKGALNEKRVPWSHQLTKEEAAEYSSDNILGPDCNDLIPVSEWTQIRK